MKQYTIRNIPEGLDHLLRKLAHKRRQSLNETVLWAIQASTGFSATPVIHHDLDSLSGTWIADAECDAALADQRKIDESLWQ